MAKDKHYSRLILCMIMTVLCKWVDKSPLPTFRLIFNAKFLPGCLPFFETNDTSRILFLNIHRQHGVLWLTCVCSLLFVGCLQGYTVNRGLWARQNGGYAITLLGDGIMGICNKFNLGHTFSYKYIHPHFSANK